MSERMESRTGGGRRLLYGIVIAQTLLIAAVGLIGYRMIEKLSDDMAALESETKNLAADIGLLEKEMSRRVTEFQVEDTQLAPDIGSIAEGANSTGRAVDQISFDLDDVRDRIEEVLESLGRCLYHEAELHRYTYYYEEGFGGRYITGCD